jgi:DNA-binding transcriptional regulator YiaG
MTGAQLRERRERLGLSQSVLAKIWGVRQATVSDWETETKPMQHPEIVEMALQTLERQHGTQTKKRRA